MTRTATSAVLILLAAAAGLALRLPQLNLRLMHGDEAVHAYKCNELWTTGEYAYDPDEYHGPTLYYLTIPVMWLRGAADWRDVDAATFRIVPMVFGVGLILLLLLVADGLGRAAIVCAAVLTALSPAMTFYSRYYIQETLLVFFTLLVIAAGWRYVRSWRMGWALLAGAGVGLMHATKETAVIALGALAVALLAAHLWKKGERPLFSADGKALGAALLVAVFVSATLFSTFFTNLRGPADSLRAYATYFERAGGGLHTHPWHYYLGLLLHTRYPAGPLWSEALILVLGAVGLVAALRRSAGGLLRAVGLYTLALGVIYAAIPYKTPWCALGFLHGAILLAGVGTVTLVRWASGGFLRLAAVVVLLGLAGSHLGVQAWRASHHKVFANDVRNAYVYAHPVGGVARLADYLQKVAAALPPERPMIIKVMTRNEWPLPWYLRSFDYVGYWNTVPPDPDADVILVSTAFEDELEAARQDDYQVNVCGLRRDETLLTYVRRDLYDAFVRHMQVQQDD